MMPDANHKKASYYYLIASIINIIAFAQGVGVFSIIWFFGAGFSVSSFTYYFCLFLMWSYYITSYIVLLTAIFNYLKKGKHLKTSLIVTSLFFVLCVVSLYAFQWYLSR